MTRASASRFLTAYFTPIAIIVVGIWLTEIGMTLIRRHEEILAERGLDVELLDKLGVKSSNKLGDDCIAIPYFRGEDLVGVKYRTISGEKRFLQDAGSEQIFYNINALTDQSLEDSPIIITEGEPDCWAAIQSGFLRTVSVPGGAPGREVADRAAAKYDFLAGMPNVPDRLPIILAVDGDEAGSALRADLAIRLGRKRCLWVKYPKGCKDLNDVLRRYGTRGVRETLNRAAWIVGNVFRMSDIPPVPEAVPHVSTFPGLDAHYRLRLGDFCVVTGVPAMGKSTFVGDLCCRMVQVHRWPTTFASFEQEPTLDHRRMLRTWYGGRPVKDMDHETIAQADHWIDEWFSWVVPDDDSHATLDWVMERLAVAAIRFGARLIVLDPWNEVEHDRPEGMSLTEYVGVALRNFRRFVRKYEVHLIVVAHPMKLHRDKEGNYPIPTLYDISDSAHWYNRADVGVIVHRTGEDETLVRIGKSRFQDQIGTPGDVKVRYVWQRASYEEI